LHERTYEGLLGQLGTEPKVWAECLFADPIADVAVLGSPDDQELSEQAEAYRTLVGECTPMRISDAPNLTRAWLLSLDGHWFGCGVKRVGWIENDGFWIEGADADIRGGMSGSPIIDRYGSAIGVVSLRLDHDHATGGDPIPVDLIPVDPNPRLANNLPGWLLRELERPRGRRA
jgi:hypothetical protein